MIAPIQPVSAAKRVPSARESIGESDLSLTHGVEALRASRTNRICLEMKRCVERNPVAAVAAAAGMGVILGLVCKRWR